MEHADAIKAMKKWCLENRFYSPAIQNIVLTWRTSDFEELIEIGHRGSVRAAWETLRHGAALPEAVPA